MMGGKLEFYQTIEAGIDVLLQGDTCTWFEWNGGSSLVFWRQHDFGREARDGFPTHFVDNRLRDTPKKFSKPTIPENKGTKALLVEKLERILSVRYLSPGYVHWDIRFFGVPKGETDIRIVYDGTKNGINKMVWIPTFYLPISVSLSRLLEPKTYQMDMDVGEMFYNFMLNTDVQAYCGVNVTGLDLDVASTNRYRWNRTWMGFKPSPHNAARHLAIATELAMGDPLDCNNAFFQDKLILNLPCSEKFNPSMPWLYKLDSRVGQIAPDVVTFMDDSRVTDYSVESCWQASRQLASRLQFLGIQDAARKK